MRKCRFSQGCRNVHSFASHPSLAAVLVAISIPIFTAQLEKSREAVDEANLRSAYAECSASVLTGVASDDATVTVTDEDGVITATKDVVLKQAKDGWEKAPNIAGIDVDDFDAGATVTVTVTDDGSAATFAAAAAAADDAADDASGGATGSDPA